jgi:hypothetical protein
MEWERGKVVKGEILLYVRSYSLFSPSSDAAILPNSLSIPFYTYIQSPFNSSSENFLISCPLYFSFPHLLSCFRSASSFLESSRPHLTSILSIHSSISTTLPAQTQMSIIPDISSFASSSVLSPHLLLISLLPVLRRTCAG